MSEKQRQAFMSSGKLISIAEATDLVPYSNEYLSLLARKGRLPAVKIARNWLTTRDAVLSYVTKQERKHRKILEQFAQAQRRLR